MHQQPGDRTCANEAIGGAHYGPVQVYMYDNYNLTLCDTNLALRAKVADASTAVGYSSSWFKVAEMGMPSSNPDYWGTGKVDRYLKNCQGLISIDM